MIDDSLVRLEYDSHCAVQVTAARFCFDHRCHAGIASNELEFIPPAAAWRGRHRAAAGLHVLRCAHWQWPQHGISSHKIPMRTG